MTQKKEMEKKLKTIWKFDISLAKVKHAVEMPLHAKIVHVGMKPQDTQSWGTIPVFSIWAEVETETSLRKTRTFYIVGTGHEIPDQSQHIGTMVMNDSYVWHIYEGV